MTWKCIPHYWPFVCGFHRSPVDSPHEGPSKAELWYFLSFSPNKLLIKQSSYRLFERLWRPCEADVLLETDPMNSMDLWINTNSKDCSALINLDLVTHMRVGDWWSSALWDPRKTTKWRLRDVDWRTLAKGLLLQLHQCCGTTYINRSPSVDIFKSRIKTYLVQLVYFT